MGVEVGVGTSTPAGGVPNRFLFQRAFARHELTSALELTVGARLTEDLAAERTPDPSTRYLTGSDVIATLSAAARLDLTKRWSLALAGVGSSSSSRDVATMVDGPRTSNWGHIRAQSNSIGGSAELGFDSFDEDRAHDVDVEVVASGGVTRFGSMQQVVAGPADAGTGGAASLIQGAATLATTLTFAQDTDVALEAAYFFYDDDPGKVGLAMRQNAERRDWVAALGRFEG